MRALRALRRVALDELEGAVDFHREAPAASRDQTDVGTLLLEATAQQDEAALEVVLDLGQPQRRIQAKLAVRGLEPYTDDDLDAMFAYLQSVPPIKHHVPQPVPTAPQASASR